MIPWADKTGMDVFNLVRTVEPVGLKSFIDLVVPELPNRGHYKTGYDPGSMRKTMFPNGGYPLTI